MTSAVTSYIVLGLYSTPQNLFSIVVNPVKSPNTNSPFYLYQQRSKSDQKKSEGTTTWFKRRKQWKGPTILIG